MKILLLAGTSDARRIAHGLASIKHVTAIASLAGVTRQPIELACETRVGGFGGAHGLRCYVQEENVGAILDATHPFAAQMSQNAAGVCKDLRLPYIQMLRPEWQAEAEDRWTRIASEAQAVEHIAPGSTVFLATGRQTLPAFANLQSCTLICRQIDPPKQSFPFSNGHFLFGRPPFSVNDEKELFQRLNIDWLVVKNSGAQASRSKLDAARELGLRVAMIDRPKQPDSAKVTTVDQALNWAHELSAAQ
ncbi:MAG: precorrin-6A/cobalt-precorrin-6A reductase [Paracoccaceae bacterium]|jgi:precorrin-6A/cobalt-precorrin-6A reductase